MRSLGRRVSGRDHGAKDPGKESTDETEQQGASEGKLGTGFWVSPELGKWGLIDLCLKRKRKKQKQQL